MEDAVREYIVSHTLSEKNKGKASAFAMTELAGAVAVMQNFCEQAQSAAPSSAKEGSK